jgi:hypothetical protein
MASMTVTQGSTYAEQGATALDTVDGDLTSHIQITGTVDTSTVGTYTLSYTVSDAAGNSTMVTRSVGVTAVAVTSVVGTPPPTDGATTTPSSPDPSVASGIRPHPPRADKM